MTKVRKVSSFISLAVLVSFASGSAVADDIRRDMLARDHEKCVLGCLMSNDAAVCEVLCDCTVTKFSELEFEDHVRLQIELDSGRVTDAHRAWLDGAALACAAEVDARFPELVPQEKVEPDPEAPQVED